MHSAASVNAVTKSGTNNLHGNVFEFFRDSQFNAPAYFAPVGPDGKKSGDGLNRNQFGGTLGGPIIRDKLFVFGALSAHACSSADERQRRVRPHGGHDGRRLHRGRFTRVQRGPTGRAPRAVRQQPGRSGALQYGRGEDAGLRVHSIIDRSVRRDPVQRAARRQQRTGRRQDGLSDERQPLHLRPLPQSHRVTSRHLGADAQHPGDSKHLRSEEPQEGRDDSRSAIRWCSAPAPSTRFARPTCGHRRGPTRRRTNFSTLPPSESPSTPTSLE